MHFPILYSKQLRIFKSFYSFLFLLSLIFLFYSCEEKGYTKINDKIQLGIQNKKIYQYWNLSKTNKAELDIRFDEAKPLVYGAGSGLVHDTKTAKVEYYNNIYWKESLIEKQDYGLDSIIKKHRVYILDSISNSEMDTLFFADHDLFFDKVNNENNDTTFLLTKINSSIKYQRSNYEIVPNTKYGPLLRYHHEGGIGILIYFGYGVYENIGAKVSSMPEIIYNQQYIYSVDKKVFDRWINRNYKEERFQNCMKAVFNLKGKAILKVEDENLQSL